MIKVAITGSTGLVGSRIQELLYHDFEFIPLLHHHIDLTDQKEVASALSTIDFDMLLHLSSYTNVDQAEKEKDGVHKLNVEATRYVYEETVKNQKKFIYISTDFVFDGTNPPYTEKSIPNPLGVYGKTKYEGEQIVKNNAMIVRISYPYRAVFGKKTDFIRSLYQYLKQGKRLSMITDSKVTPTFIDDIAYGLKYLIQNYSPEVFHLVGSESLSPYKTAHKIAKHFDLDTALIGKTTFTEFSEGRAPRPKYSEIKSIKNNFYSMMSLEEGLQKLVF